MSSFNITRDQVVRKIIKIRCKFASRLSDVSQNLEFVSFADSKQSKMPIQRFSQGEECAFVYSLFPARRKWCHLGIRRLDVDSTKRNEYKLYYTYLKAKKEQSKDLWYQNLCDFADSILNLLYNPGDSLSKPKVCAIEKERDDNMITCRPVCKFSLKNKIALSLINKVLTDLFDDFFYSCSYAFRTPNSERQQFQHLNAVNAIKSYREQHKGLDLYVAECDMQKFYDTIDHDVIKKRFCILLRRAKVLDKISHQEYRILKQWFYNYVDCFDFYADVYKYNKASLDHEIWKSIKDKANQKCCIKWVKQFFVRGKYIDKKQRKGVPQGGALSGLVANVVMHFVDRDVMHLINNDDVLYCRFCDDMIIIGPDKTKVNQVFHGYENSVVRSKLFPHDLNKIEISKMSEFWLGKSRGPYKWGEKGNDVYPWITFVGFDCNWMGNLRIRKRSLKKEVDKQYTVVNDFLDNYRKSSCRPKYCMLTMKSSLTSRLIGMSVGRISLRNYKNNPNIHSWMSAFSILDRNLWSERQLKLLDAHRSLMIYRAVKFLKKIECPQISKKGRKEKGYTGYVGKPFSYYGQCFDYKK